MRGRIFVILVFFLLSVPSFIAASDGSDSQEIEMVVWEHQNWETNGGYERLTIWRDGHSQVEVSPCTICGVRQMNLKPKSGWKEIRQERHIAFFRNDIYSPDVARMKLHQAHEAGIQDLTTFRPAYLDGGGTRVVVKVNGAQKETIIPMFMDEDKETANFKRFVAVSRILNGFDRDAYEIPDN